MVIHSSCIERYGNIIYAHSHTDGPPRAGGHFLTNDLSDDIDIRRQCRVLNVRGNILCRKFHMCSVPVKLKLFNSYCSSYKLHHICG